MIFIFSIQLHLNHNFQELTELYTRKKRILTLLAL